VRRGHEIIEHTADVGLRVWAPTLDELFSEAALAMVALMGTPTSTEPRSEHLELEAADLEALFVDWLSEVLFLFEARELVPRDVRVRVSREPWRVAATIEGVSAVDLEQTGPAVKAVTFHGLEVSETEAKVYLDV
jgi:SHS2 domain-containing protein